MMEQYKASCGNVFLRKGPSTKTPVIKLIPTGGIVTAEESPKDGWIYCEYEGMLGYCKANNLTLCENVEYDDDNIGAAFETAIRNARDALDELEKIVKMML
jgi:hypothetical protein